MSIFILVCYCFFPFYQTMKKLGILNHNNHRNMINNSHHLHYPFQSRPMTCCFGMVFLNFQLFFSKPHLQVPTPQVTMGACFVTVLHRAQIRVNYCTEWFHPANRKQFMIIGAEQGIYAMDLSDMSIMDESPLIQVQFCQFIIEFSSNDRIVCF